MFLEAEMTDSVSGERLGLAVRRGTGQRLKKTQESGREVTLESIQPLLDQVRHHEVPALGERLEEIGVGALVEGEDAPIEALPRVVGRRDRGGAADQLVSVCASVELKTPLVELLELGLG